MSTIVTNRGVWERTTSGHKDTNVTESFSDQGTVRVWYQGIEYVFGPGESKSFWDDGIAAAVAAGDSRLAIADSQEGLPKSNASLSVTRW